MSFEKLLNYEGTFVRNTIHDKEDEHCEQLWQLISYTLQLIGSIFMQMYFIPGCIVRNNFIQISNIYGVFCGAFIVGNTRILKSVSPEYLVGNIGCPHLMRVMLHY